MSLPNLNPTPYLIRSAQLALLRDLTDAIGVAPEFKYDFSHEPTNKRLSEVYSHLISRLGDKKLDGGLSDAFANATQLGASIEDALKWMQGLLSGSRKRVSYFEKGLEAGCKLAIESLTGSPVSGVRQIDRAVPSTPIILDVIASSVPFWEHSVAWISKAPGLEGTPSVSLLRAIDFGWFYGTQTTDAVGDTGKTQKEIARDKTLDALARAEFDADAQQTKALSQWRKQTPTRSNNSESLRAWEEEHSREGQRIDVDGEALLKSIKATRDIFTLMWLPAHRLDSTRMEKRNDPDCNFFFKLEDPYRIFVDYLGKTHSGLAFLSNEGRRCREPKDYTLPNTLPTSSSFTWRASTERPRPELDNRNRSSLQWQNTDNQLPARPLNTLLDPQTDTSNQLTRSEHDRSSRTPFPERPIAIQRSDGSGGSQMDALRRARLANNLHRYPRSIHSRQLTTSQSLTSQLGSQGGGIMRRTNSERSVGSRASRPVLPAPSATSQIDAAQIPPTIVLDPGQFSNNPYVEYLNSLQSNPSHGLP